MKTFKEYYNENFDPTTLLDSAMNQVQQGGADLRTIRRTLIMLSNDPQQKEYLASDQFVHDLEAKLDLSDQEMGIHGEKNSKCTGPTKKASSTSKGKKYMKCVKSGSGYKRIHWGQKGAKAGSGNSKRKKAFRARHKCSSAKANTPRGQACKDW